MAISSAIAHPEFVHQDTHQGLDILEATVSADGRYLLTYAVDPGKGHDHIIKVFSTSIWRDIPERRCGNGIYPRQRKATRLWRKNFGELSGRASFSHDMERVVMVTDTWVATYRTTDGKQLSKCSRPKATRSWPYEVSVVPDGSGIVSAPDHGFIIYFVSWSGEVTQTLQSEDALTGQVLVSPRNKWVIAGAGVSPRRTSLIWNRVSGQFVGAFESRLFPGPRSYISNSRTRPENLIRETSDEVRMVSWSAGDRAMGESSAWLSTLAIEASSGEILKRTFQPLELGPIQPNEWVGDLLLTPDWSVMAVQVNGIFRRLDREKFPGCIDGENASVSADGHQLVSYNGRRVLISSTDHASLREELHGAQEAALILEHAFGTNSIQATLVREVVLQHTSLLMQKACRVQDDTAPGLWAHTTRTVASPTIGEPTYKADDGCILL